MEGSIFIAGAGVQWLRDRMKFFKKAPETEKIVKSLKDISKNWSLDHKFSPKMKNKSIFSLIAGWNKAVKRALIN